MKNYFYRLIVCAIIVAMTNAYVFQFNVNELVRFLFVMVMISFPFALYDWLRKK